MNLTISTYSFISLTNFIGIGNSRNRHREPMSFERCRNVILLVCFYLLISHFATNTSNPTSSLPPISAHESASTPTFAPVHLPHVWIEFFWDSRALRMRVEQDARQEDVEYCLESDCDKPNKQCESWAHCGRSCTIDPQDHFALAHKPCRFRVGGRQTFWVDHSQVILAPEVRCLFCLITIPDSDCTHLRV